MLLFSPSLLSLVVVVVLAFGILGVSNWSFFTYNGWVFDFFYGDHGVVTAIEHSSNALAALQQGISSSPILYSAGIALAAIGAAVVVFVGVRSLERGVHALRTIEASSAAARREGLEHAVVRIGVIAVWAVYWLFFLNIALPYCLLLSRIGAEDIMSLQGIGLNIVALFGLIVALHLHVVLLRLLFLRPRLLGGDAYIESAIIDAS